MLKTITVTAENVTGRLINQSTHKHGGAIYSLFVGDQFMGTAGVIAKLPKTYTELRPGRNYLTNDWAAPDFIEGVRQDNVTYTATRAEAVAALTAVARRMMAAS